MIVVADTSVILNLCRIQQECLLLELFGRVIILGHDVAAKLGLRTIGILGILLESKQRKLIPGVTPVLDRLDSEAGFWIAPSLRQRVLRLAGK